jgi:hypothetical protein
MPSTGTAPGVSKAPASINSNQKSPELKSAVSLRVLQGAHCFYGIVALIIWNSLFTILGSHVHHFTELGVTAFLGGLAAPSGMGSAVQVIASGWLAAGFLALGYYAVKGEEWAFAVGMAAYAVDGALMVASGDFVAAAFHALALYAIYRGVAALGQPSSSKPSRVVSAAHAG